MDDVLELVQFEEFFKALQTSMKRSVSAKASWLNPSAARVAGQVSFTAWRHEHQDEVRAFTEKGVAAANEWREKNRDQFLVNSLKGVIAFEKRREENPEEYRAMIDRFRLSAKKRWREMPKEEVRAYWKRVVAAGKIWRAEHPDKFRVNLKKAEKARLQEYAKRYSDRLRIIKPYIPTTGIRLYELKKFFPQWSLGQLLLILRRAVQCGDLVRIKIYRNNVRYYHG